MPVYEYGCESCQKVTEEMQKFSDAPLTDCPACGGKGTLKKLISRSSFALKGTGWYTTDYKRAPAAASSADKTASAAPAANSETKVAATDAKPASTTKTESSSLGKSSDS